MTRYRARTLLQAMETEDRTTASSPSILCSISCLRSHVVRLVPTAEARVTVPRRRGFTAGAFWITLSLPPVWARRRPRRVARAPPRATGAVAVASDIAEATTVRSKTRWHGPVGARANGGPSCRDTQLPLLTRREWIKHSPACADDDPLGSEENYIGWLEVRFDGDVSCISHAYSGC